ncbi:BREX-5 system adenine-specific DNA-methyltransferase PglX [Haloplanus aerogenes]|uniref:site-specific DNA-methyltransferase (adenine-specific) n=1 Tax=Haloplanus aerogenes TaxID=660522 RepID=A0A3M0D8U5_9EURY|nr:BREX-5 system adenine-specific DNA-methyltransferase PglX [Haloplanus aerogenes]AZH26393.1 BREX-5 system adenine-specific DNA-methyltransferase PglX [Haloplanus aerogenes]RMB18142.1 N-6 DNA methylase [Haloplanus aerogenes]
MEHNSLSRQKAQLDKTEREHLEDVVEELRSRVEDNVRFQLTQHGLDDEPEDGEPLDEEIEQLVEAIEIEGADGHTWEEAFEKYIAGVGYTIVNRLAALRCMEVRDFIDEEVTVFKENGLTPAAETLVHEEFLLEDEAILAAYHNSCDELADEIEILFDRSSTYSLIDPDDDTFEELCRMLDDIPDAVWRADDVLGWIYEYYNRPVVEALDAKNTLEPEDVGPANQFYTPHWVVRMLTDNSLGKLYLEATGQADTVPDAKALSPDERKNRLVTPEDAPSVPELCTYLIPDDDNHDAPDFDHPRELRIIDPACGSGHFLLYAFDVLERIWWAETDLDRGEVPEQILKHNLYGVDIDLRSCQLSAFNLYLKARTRAESEGNTGFEMPSLGIVTADARVADVEEAIGVLDTITGDGTDVRDALDDVIDDFQTTEALGSLLDVQGTLDAEFESGQTDIMGWGGDAPKTLNGFLKRLETAVEERTSDSFGEQNLRSFLNLLVVLTQDYDVALMNPPYGSGGRMPADVQEYVEEHFDYKTEYYINFFEACDRFVRTNGRIGMLVPRSFMFLTSFRDFREDFVGGRGTFDFLAEYGIDILDNATVRTAGTVVRSGVSGRQEGTFIRLEDVDKSAKEHAFLRSAFVDPVDDGVQRIYTRDIDEFELIPGMPLSYWVPRSLRSLYDSQSFLDADKGHVDGDSLGEVSAGLCTGDDGRFVRKFWEVNGDASWVPFAKGGEDAWLLPRVTHSVNWAPREMESQPGGRVQNVDNYFSEALSYTVAKESGRRFGYLHSSSIFSHKGSVLIPDRCIWNALSYTNSHLFTYLMLAQTTERMWEIGLVSKVPWMSELETQQQLEALAREAVGYLVSKRQYDFNSPHYDGPILLDVLGAGESLPQYDHPHRELRDDLTLVEPTRTVDESASIEDLGTAAARHLESVDSNLQACAEAIDDAVFDCFDISDDQCETVLQEIALRTNEDPRERETYDPESISEPSEEFPKQVKDLLLHFALQVIHDDDDGIVPISRVDGEDNLLARIETEFERVWGDDAADRLAEVDRVLGSKTADEEAYPNLRTWLEDDLFDYHISTFDRTPILWQLTSERLVSDPEGEGFACLVDYHQMDGGLFDRLTNRYLEPRKALLRERRSVANRRRSDSSLSASEQAVAAEEYARCESGLEQISVLEERFTALAQSAPREWPAEERELAGSMVDRVAEFRERTAHRLDVLDELANCDDVDMAELFSPSFYDTVDEHREEWLDALEDLEDAFEAYTEDGETPIEPHLYDFFAYYDDLIGSAHYASNGILFTTYYYEQFEEADQSQLGGQESNECQQLVSQLASGVDEYKRLAAEIDDACEEITRAIPSDWEERALSEITTDGYQPNHKHGVELNITPLVDAEIVPEIVDTQVI